MHFCGKKILRRFVPCCFFPPTPKGNCLPTFSVNYKSLDPSNSDSEALRWSFIQILLHMKSWFDPQVCNVWIHIPLTYLEEPIAHLSRIFDPKFSAIFFGHHLPQLFSVLNLGFITDHYFSYSPGFRVYCWLRI